jgi:Mn2+/Fe2+ NRAMP family transporter
MIGWVSSMLLVLVLIQVLNGALLPVILIFMLRLINDERLTGELRNTRFYNILGWGTFALVTAAVTMMLGTQLLGLLAVTLFGK